MRLIRLRDGDAYANVEQIVGIAWHKHVVHLDPWAGTGDAHVIVFLAGGHKITEFFGQGETSDDKAERRYLDVLSVWQDT